MDDSAKFQPHQMADDKIVIIFAPPPPPPVLRLFHVVCLGPFDYALNCPLNSE